MKKTTVFIIALLCSVTIHAQWGKKKVKGNNNVTTETRTTSDYSSIGVAGFFDVDLVDGEEGHITLEGESNLLEYVITEVKDGSLKIKVKKGVNLKPSMGKKIHVTVTVKDIKGVSLAGSGDIVSKVSLKASTFKTSLAGSGDITLDVNADEMKVSIAGSGDISLKGSAKHVKASIAGSGDISAFGFKADKVSASISGSGSVEIHAEDEIKARIAGSGDIIYTGNPSKEDSKVSGSGRIRSRN